MPRWEIAAVNPTEHNNKVIADIGRMVEYVGTNRSAKIYDVNPCYVSELCNHGRIPSNPEIAQRMGFVVHKYSVPHGASKKQKRFIVYPGTKVDKIKAGMKEITGVEWVPLTEELEY